VANTLSVIDMVTRESLRIAHEKMTFLGTIDRSYDSSFAKTGGKIGDSLRIRMPNQYTRRRGSRVMDVQDQKEATQLVTVAIQDGVDMKFNSAELSLSIDELSQRYIEPAVSVLVAGIEGDVLTGVSKDVYQVTGTAGTVVGSSSGDISAITDARAKLNQQLAPKDGNRAIQFDSVTMGAIVNGNKALFHDGGQIKEAFREGFISRNAMADWYENEKTYTHTNGSDADVAWAVDDVDSTAQLAAADADASGNTPLTAMNFDAMGTAGPSVGSVFTISGLFDCHPETKQKYAHLKQLVVTAVGTVASNQATITFSPPIYIKGPKQNAYTATGAAAELENDTTVLFGAASGIYRQNLMYHKDAFTFVTADLPLMDDAIKCVRRVQDGLSIRVWQGSDIRNDELLLRMDILYGYKTLRPEWAVRISN
jgi:hypothetical protein